MGRGRRAAPIAAPDLREHAVVALVTVDSRVPRDIESLLPRTRLDVAALTMHEVVQLSPDCIEGGVDGAVQVSLLGRVRRHKLTAGHPQVDGHPVVRAPALPVVRLDRNAATDDAMRQRFQLVGPRANVSFHRRRPVDTVKRDLER
jgi:hypothetical protein